MDSKTLIFAIYLITGCVHSFYLYKVLKKERIDTQIYGVVSFMLFAHIFGQIVSTFMEGKTILGFTVPPPYPNNNKSMYVIADILQLIGGINAAYLYNTKEKNSKKLIPALSTGLIGTILCFYKNSNLIL